MTKVVKAITSLRKNAYFSINEITLKQVQEILFQVVHHEMRFPDSIYPIPDGDVELTWEMETKKVSCKISDECFDVFLWDKTKISLISQDIFDYAVPLRELHTESLKNALTFLYQ